MCQATGKEEGGGGGKEREERKEKDRRKKKKKAVKDRALISKKGEKANTINSKQD